MNIVVKTGEFVPGPPKGCLGLFRHTVTPIHQYFWGLNWNNVEGGDLHGSVVVFLICCMNTTPLLIFSICFVAGALNPRFFEDIFLGGNGKFLSHRIQWNSTKLQVRIHHCLGTNS